MNEATPLKTVDVEAAAAAETTTRSGSGRGLALGFVALAAAGLLWSAVVTPGLIGPPANTVASLWWFDSEDLSACKKNNCGEPYKPKQGPGRSFYGGEKKWDQVTPETRRSCGWAGFAEAVSPKEAYKDVGCTYCAGGQCILKKPLGFPCGDDNDCQTDHCLTDTHKVCACGPDTGCIIERAVAFFISKAVGVPIEKVTLSASITEDLGAKQSDIDKLVVDIIPYVFGKKVNIPEKLTTLADLARLVKKKTTYEPPFTVRGVDVFEPAKKWFYFGEDVFE